MGWKTESHPILKPLWEQIWLTVERKMAEASLWISKLWKLERSLIKNQLRPRVKKIKIPNWLKPSKKLFWKQEVYEKAGSN